MIFCIKQKTAYDLRVSDWSSDVCSSDLRAALRSTPAHPALAARNRCRAADGRTRYARAGAARTDRYAAPRQSRPHRTRPQRPARGPRHHHRAGGRPSDDFPRGEGITEKWRVGKEWVTTRNVGGSAEPEKNNKPLIQ